jgi:hypothetical protein
MTIQVVSRCSVLLAVVLIALPLALWLGREHYGPAGIWSMAAAAAVCTTSSILALLLTVSGRGPQGAVTGTLMGSLVRFGLPVAMGMLLGRSGTLADGGLMPGLLGFYLLTLAVETPLAISLIHRDRASARATKGP